MEKKINVANLTRNSRRINTVAGTGEYFVRNSNSSRVSRLLPVLSTKLDWITTVSVGKALAVGLMAYKPVHGGLSDWRVLRSFKPKS